MRTRNTLRLISSSAVIVSLSVLTGACGLKAPSEGSSNTPASVTTHASDHNDTFTVAVADQKELLFNPLMGPGENGESKIYDSLYRLADNSGEEKTFRNLEPVLAQGEPTHSADVKQWTVKIRKGVTFSDGSELGAKDVVATYRAMLDPQSAAPIASRYGFITSVDQVGDDEVRFTLSEGYADFARRLTLAIAPESAFSKPGPAKDSSLNKHPVGSGPYELKSLNATEAVLEARPNYWGSPKPQVKRFVMRYVADEGARLAQVIAGEADGARIPYGLVKSAQDQGLNVTPVHTGDFRSVTLPADNPVTGDKAVRLALNYAIDRKSLVDDVLKGYGSPNSTLFAPFYGNAYDSASDFTYDPKKAEKILDDAGWVKGSDGIRSKDGLRAAFNLAYYNVEQLRLDLTLAVQKYAHEIGIEVTPVAVQSKDTNAQYLAKNSFLLGYGLQASTIDGQIYNRLHSKFIDPSVGSQWDNISHYNNERVDQDLDQARKETDPAKSDELYRNVQHEYHENPASVYLVYLDHVYVMKSDTASGWNGQAHAFEPHAHGVAWGPWYSLARWVKK